MYKTNNREEVRILEQIHNVPVVSVENKGTKTNGKSGERINKVYTLNITEKEVKELLSSGEKKVANEIVFKQVEEEKEEPVVKEIKGAECKVCGKVLKNANGLRLHSRSHKKEEKK